MPRLTIRQRRQRRGPPGAGRAPRYNDRVSCPLVLAALIAASVQVQVPAQPQPAPGNPVAVISTSMGDITIELLRDKAPVSVANFLRYAADNFYDGTVFHRVVKGFVVQGGGLTPELVEKGTLPPIQNEATNGLRNLRGSVAMARKQALRSATAQFFFNVGNNSDLDHRGFSPPDFGYAVFGRVLSGMDVVDRIASVPTRTTGGMEDVPIEPVVITNVTITP
jgi:peptidyl-prolyl cis-trans isomerase B (cyclophilin B)